MACGAGPFICAVPEPTKQISVVSLRLLVLYQQRKSALTVRSTSASTAQHPNAQHELEREVDMQKQSIWKNLYKGQAVQEAVLQI